MSSGTETDVDDVVATESEDAWFPWPAFITLAWGIGVAMNAWEVYLRKPISEDEIRREMDRFDARA